MQWVPRGRCSHGAMPASRLLTRAAAAATVLFTAAATCAQDPDALDEPATGTIRILVRWDGPVPALPDLRFTGDPACTGGAPQQQVLVATDGTLHNVVVELTEGRPDDDGPRAAGARHILEQRDCLFTPRVIALRTGDVIELRNAGTNLMNVNARPARNRRLNHVLRSGAVPVEIAFDRAEPPFLLKSDIHPWNYCHAALFGHGWFVVTNDAPAELTGLKAGEYELEAWHERYARQRVTVRLGHDGPAEALFIFSERPGQGAHPPAE